ncbi:MAG: branched-chain amino acid aminotransferase, partial [Spirochaetes bacterium]|nr:branched-chain amino acid aminotransferase [Spirochaetota bacterium]
MERADLDFPNLDFSYRKCDYNIRYHFKNGQWDKGELVQDDHINIHIAATCLHYGQSCFEGLKVFETKNGDFVAFRPDENSKRLNRSAQKIFMKTVPEEIFLEALNRVVLANKKYIPPYGSGASLYVRPLLFGASPKVGVKPSDDYTFLILVDPVGPYFKAGFKPVKMLVVNDLDRAAPQGVGDVKVAGNYAAGLRGSHRAKSNGYAEVVYLDALEKKYIDESGPANFIAILKDGTFVTPQSPSILPSITNMSLQQIAEEEFGWKVEKRPLAIEEINHFAEAGCCGTAAIITPIGTINYQGKDYDLGDGKEPGPKLTQLYQY